MVAHDGRDTGCVQGNVKSIQRYG